MEKVIKKLYNWFKKNNMQPIDPQLIQAKVNEFNAKGQPGAPYWVAAEGLTGLTSMTRENGVVSFNPNNGIPAKVFVNTQTGEIRIFDARLFTVKN